MKFSKRQLNEAFDWIGYRQMNDCVWGKPFGSCLITIKHSDDSIKIVQNFMSLKGVGTWTGSDIDLNEIEDSNDLKDAILSFERYSFKEVQAGSMPDFGFRSLEFDFLSE